MRKFFMVIIALIVAVVVGVVIFRRLTEDQGVARGTAG